MKQRRFKFLLLFFSFILLILLAEGVYYWRLTKGRERPEAMGEIGKVRLEKYVAVKDIPVFELPNSTSPFGYLASGRGFEVLEQRSEWLNIKNEQASTAWIKIDETAYKPAQGE